MNKKKIILFIIMILIGLYASYKKLEENKTLSNDEVIVKFIIDNTFVKGNIISRITNNNIEWEKTLRLLQNDYEEVTLRTNTEEKEPIIYLYNSHPTEEYAPSTIGEYYLNPTIIMNNYIMEDIFNKNNYKTYVEEESVKDILNQNNWNYASSYKASRILLEKRKEEYPSLKYFIDIHRDSLEKSKTTIEIGDRVYAKLLFIIGLENNNYQENLEFTEKILEKLDTYYPGLSKGIYKKEGPGVNGVYNQDFSPKTILIEIGGYENTTTEVLNSSIAFTKCFMEVLNEENTTDD